MSSLGVPHGPPRARKAVPPPTPLRKSHVGNVRDTSQGSGSSPACAPGVGPPASRPPRPPHPRRGLPCLGLPAHKTQACTAHGRLHLGPSPPLSPLPPPSPLLPPPSSGASGAGPEPREPGRRVSEERYKRPRGTAKVPAAESPPGRAAAAEEEENAEAGRTPARADRRRAAAPGSRCLLLALSLRGEPGRGERGGAGSRRRGPPHLPAGQPSEGRLGRLEPSFRG